MFYKINEEDNTDREKDLKKELKTFTDIYSNAKDILEEKKYEPFIFMEFCFAISIFISKLIFQN